MGVDIQLPLIYPGICSINLLAIVAIQFGVCVVNIAVARLRGWWHCLVRLHGHGVVFLILFVESLDKLE
jgi:hypothetical protein